MMHGLANFKFLTPNCFLGKPHKFLLQISWRSRTHCNWIQLILNKSLISINKMYFRWYLATEH